MGYKIYRKCDEIPLCKFIDMYNGDLSVLIIEGRPDEKELKMASSLLIEEYSSIVGNKSLLFEINNQARIIKYHSKIALAETARNMLKCKLYDEAKTVLNYLGIKMIDNYSDSSLLSVVRSIDSVIGESKLRLEMIKNGGKARNTSKNDKADFTKERMMVCAHFKMHIDPKIFTASEYGNLLKMMLDELKEMKSNGK